MFPDANILDTLPLIIRLRKLIKALSKINRRRLLERKTKGAMNLETKILQLRIHIVLRKQTPLSLDVLLVDVESAGVFVQVEKIATGDDNLVVEE